MLVSPVKLTSVANLFRDCGTLRSVPVSLFD